MCEKSKSHLILFYSLSLTCNRLPNRYFKITILKFNNSERPDHTHMMRAKSKTVENVIDRPPIHTKMAHLCSQILEMVDFKDGTPTKKFENSIV